MHVFFSKYGKAIALIAGFLFSTLGALWALLVTEKLSSQIQQLTNIKTVNSTAIDRLNRLSSEYFIANQQGDLIFVLAAQAEADQELVADLIKGNLLDRATPVRNMLSELALENQLQYRDDIQTYTRLSDQAHADLTPANFKAVKAREQDVIMKGQARVPVLVQENADIDRSLSAKQAQQTLNRLLGVSMAIIGSAVLLSANLITERANEFSTAKAQVPGESAAAVAPAASDMAPTPADP